MKEFNFKQFFLNFKIGCEKNPMMFVIGFVATIVFVWQSFQWSAEKINKYFNSSTQNYYSKFEYSLFSNPNNPSRGSVVIELHPENNITWDSFFVAFPNKKSCLLHFGQSNQIPPKSINPTERIEEKEWIVLKSNKVASNISSYYLSCTESPNTICFGEVDLKNSRCLTIDLNGDLKPIPSINLTPKYGDKLTKSLIE